MEGCANCGRRHGARDACLIGVVLAVLADRGFDVEDDDASLINVDALWDGFAGPMIDHVGEELYGAAYPEAS